MSVAPGVGAQAVVSAHPDRPHNTGGRAAADDPYSALCRGRHNADLRHTFAVRTLIDWQRDRADVHANLPVLSTYLGHVEPANTYWYLTAVPELMQLAAARLEQHSTEQHSAGRQ